MDKVHQWPEWRKEFSTLVGVCVCQDKAMKGVCTPKKCYPGLYEFLYPEGGFKTKSWVARVQAKSREIYPKRRGRRKGGKKREKVSITV